MRWVVVALFVVPLIEIMLFVTIGGQIGLLWTLAIVIGTAILGSFLLTTRGRGLGARLAQETQMAGFPAKSLFEGLCLGVAAIFLMTPGFFTDAVGFLLFVGPVRAALFQFLSTRVQFSRPVHGGMGSANMGFNPGGMRFSARGFSAQGNQGPIIDGESAEVSSDAANASNATNASNAANASNATNARTVSDDRSGPDRSSRLERD